jgi:hypothetical protein
LRLYHNTSIKTLDLSNNGLDDIRSANVLRELIRRKTITNLCIAHVYLVEMLPRFGHLRRAQQYSLSLILACASWTTGMFQL